MIPVYEPLMDGNEKKYLAECIDTGWVSSDGPFVKRLEDEFAAYCGVKHGIAVSNGTAALEVGLAAIGVGQDDEVIMPSFTVVSCAIAAIRLGATPVLVDSEPDTWNMDTSRIEAKINYRTRAIMPVHIYGHPVDMDPVLDIARRHNLKVIEDAAEVHGAMYKNRKAGSIGNVGSFSFNANNIITTGEGGMVITDDPAAAERARSYRDLFSIPEHRFYHNELGYNFRMTNLQAAIGVAQLEQIDRFIEIKRRNAALYTARLSKVKGIKTPTEKPWAWSVYWMYAIELDPKLGIDATRMAQLLAQKGVATGPFFLGMHEQPVFQRMDLFQNEKYPVADRLARQGFYLPSGLTLTESQINEVCDAVEGVIKSL